MARALQKVLYTLALACLAVASKSFAVYEVNSAPPEKSIVNETARVNQNGLDLAAYVLGAGRQLSITISVATFMFEYKLYAVEYSSAEFDAILCPAETDGECSNAFYPSYSFFNVGYGTTASLEKTQVAVGTTPTTFVIKNNNVLFSVTLNIHAEVSAVPEPPAGGAGTSIAATFWFWLGIAGLVLGGVACVLGYRRCRPRPDQNGLVVVVQPTSRDSGRRPARHDPSSVSIKTDVASF